jgi:hypothetical protein
LRHFFRPVHEGGITVKRFCILMAALLALAWTSAAQTGSQAQSQSSAGASTSTNVNADKAGVNAQSSTSVNASQDTSAQHSSDRKGKSAKSETSGTASSNQSASTNGSQGSIASGTTLNAVLTKSVDSRKAKEGDEVTAKTTSTMEAAGERPIPKGTKLIGHVTKATAKGKGDADSSLGILFDRAEVGKGREVPIHAVVQAVAATTTNSAMAMNEEPAETSQAPRPAASNGGASGGGGLVGGAVSGVGKTAQNTTNEAGGVTRGAVGSASGTVRDTTGGLGASTSSTLNATSQGVVGLPGYTLDATAANATQGSIITSAGKNVKLDSGTQMVLRVVSE